MTALGKCQAEVFRRGAFRLRGLGLIGLRAEGGMTLGGLEV